MTINPWYVVLSIGHVAAGFVVLLLVSDYWGAFALCFAWVWLAWSWLAFGVSGAADGGP